MSEEKPWKRYCPQGHDTWATGRTKANGCPACLKNSNRRDRRRAQRKQTNGARQGVPGLRELRLARGYTVDQIAWEAGLSKTLIRSLERGAEEATYAERVAIFQAFNILRAREIEEHERQLDEYKRLERAGVA